MPADYCQKRCFLKQIVVRPPACGAGGHHYSNKRRRNRAEGSMLQSAGGLKPIFGDLDYLAASRGALVHANPTLRRFEQRHLAGTE
jgi:hypothetical protein